MLNNISLYLDVYKKHLNAGVDEKQKVIDLIKKVCNFEPKNIKIDESKGFIKFEANPIERSVFLEKQVKMKEELEKIFNTKIIRVG